MNRRGLIVDETPSGAMNGSNVAFVLASKPRGLLVKLNGIALLEGTDFTLSIKTITLATAPDSDDWLRVYYEPHGRPVTSGPVRCDAPIQHLGL